MNNLGITINFTAYEVVDFKTGKSNKLIKRTIQIEKKKLDLDGNS